MEVRKGVAVVPLGTLWVVRVANGLFDPESYKKRKSCEIDRSKAVSSPIYESSFEQPISDRRSCERRSLIGWPNLDALLYCLFRWLR